MRVGERLTHKRLQASSSDDQVPAPGGRDDGRRSEHACNCELNEADEAVGEYSASSGYGVPIGGRTTRSRGKRSMRSCRRCSAVERCSPMKDMGRFIRVFAAMSAHRGRVLIEYPHATRYRRRWLLALSASFPLRGRLSGEASARPAVLLAFRRPNVPWCASHPRTGCRLTSSKRDAAPLRRLACRAACRG
jgi:hypothetical protein